MDQELNPCPLYWQAGSLPLCHLGSPYILLPMVKELEWIGRKNNQEERDNRIMFEISP